MKKKEKEIRIVGSEPGDIILRVQTTKFYAIPKHLQETPEYMNLKEDWFYRHDLHSTHASRDAHEIGYSERVDGIEEISYAEYEKDIQKKIDQKKNLKELCQWCRNPSDDVKEIKLHWGPKGHAPWENEHPLKYKVCSDCRERIKEWTRYMLRIVPIGG